MMHIPAVRSHRFARAATGVGVVAATLLTSLVAMAPGASAVVPNFPDNVVVFPNRDFVSVEGYSERAGDTATVTVRRPGVGVIGSASAVVSGTDVAFEVNHPGGVCWGAGTGLNVTPDIQAGDVVAVAFPDGTIEETTTSSATVTTDMVQSGTTITVEGTLGADVGSTARLEQRIINPDLVPIIGRRDVRALPGPMVRAAKGGYSSGMTFPTPTTFRSVYQFDTQQGADTTAAADLGERMMYWQVEDAEGNRQGLTIAEFGEVGGPGFGGCPAGPSDASAPAGSASVVLNAAKTSAVVKWTQVQPVPTAEAVTGYSVEAIATADASGQQAVRGLRVGASSAQATLSGLDPAQTYTFEVRSQAGAKMSVPFNMTGATDTTVPTLSLTPAPGAAVVETNSVSVNSNGQVFFTTNGDPVITGDAPSDSAQFLPAGQSIPITSEVTLKVAAFDQAGNHEEAQGVYRPTSVALLPAPTNLAGTTTQNSVALTWGAVTGADGYQVVVYDAGGTRLAAQPPVTTVPRQTVSGLAPATTYQFTVASINAAGTGSESTPKLSRTTNQATDSVTITSARWKAGEFRIVGTGNSLGAIVQAHRVNADGSIGALITGATAQVVAAAPPGIGDYTIRLRNGAAPATNPGRIFIKSDRGGIAGPFTVANG